MILMVPVSPEVPRLHRPKLWPALIMVLTMGILYLEIRDLIEKDTLYVEQIQEILDKGKTEEAGAYLKLRPLLKIAPAKADWDLKRLILANFIHGNPVHLLLNLIGVFAGIRICTTFLPFLATVAIFLLGGSLGLCISLFVTEQFSPYIPHVGASAGIFALMGTYYVYNFRFRTTYFFWFPTRRGFTSLKTSWFFFMDVVLLEIVLSTAQLFPDRIDSVDHIAHVAGFLAGATLALALRALQKWPSFLQTRGEFLYWRDLLKYKVMSADSRSSWVVRAYLGWIELLQMNRYNDQLKLQLCVILRDHADRFMDPEVAEAFRYFNPTFVRLYTQEMSAALRSLLRQKRKIPQRWLGKLPYDSLIRLSRALADPPEEQHLLYQLMLDYKSSQVPGSDSERKLELLMLKLKNLITAEVGTSGGSPADSSQSPKEQRSKEGKAKAASG